MLHLCIRVTLKGKQVLLLGLKLHRRRCLLVGKGETMSKRNRSKKKKVHFAEADNLLVRLEEIAKSGNEDASAANSLKLWWLEHKSWTSKQWVYVKALCAKNRKKRAPAKKKFYLYAISDGSAVKLGYSSNIRSRMKSMQTGHPSTLKCIWEYYVGRSEVETKNLERKLHRVCKKHKIRGEWFGYDCMVLVNQFSIKEKMTRDFENEEQEIVIVAAAMDRI